MLNMAFADSFTGNAQPVVSPISECSSPAPDIAEGTVNAYVNSTFSYASCREYRSTKTKSIYYKLESVYDGEYTHLIPDAGKTAIDEMDYHYSAAWVFQTCQRIRELTVRTMVPLTNSKCSNQ